MSTAQLEKPLRIGPRSNGMLMTPEEFDALWDDPRVDWEEGFRYELVHGVFIVMPPPSMGERSPNDELGHLIRTYRDHHTQGSAVDATAPEQTIRAGKNRRRCDRAIWCGLGRRPDVKREMPSIVVEFVGPGTRNRKRDYVEKPREYKAAGILEYWIIDRFEQTMTVHRPGRRPLVLTAADVYCTDLMPEFELPLARIFAEASGYGDEEEG